MNLFKFILNLCETKNKPDFVNKKEYIRKIKRIFKHHWGYDLDLKNPKTYSEKMMWIRIYDNSPLKTKCADKYKVRDYVKKKIGAKYLVPLLGIFDKFEDINFDNLPNSFVIKCNHGCGYNIIVKDKSLFDKKDAEIKIKQWLNEDYFKKYGEIQYYGIKRKILVEEYLKSEPNEFFDYKYFCFNGKPHYIRCSANSDEKYKKSNIYSLDWQRKDFYNISADTLLEEDVSKPINLEEMNRLAEILAKGFKMVRVDFYNIDGKIYFGELTFTPNGGFPKFYPEEWNTKLRDLLNLNCNNKYT